MVSSEIQRQDLDPDTCKRFVPSMAIPVWAVRYHHTTLDATLSIATHGEPGSHKLSLGGFRIVPEDRAGAEGFSPEKESVSLALGMEEKVYWSRLMRIGGPLGRNELHRIVGGKCVLLPKRGFRVGEPRDIELLEFAAECLHDFEQHTSVSITTGQDLGHGVMSDGITPSLTFLHSRFKGSVLEDTSKPTGEGNFYVLRGMLRAAGIELERAHIGFIGCGNVGEHVLRRALHEGARASAIETSPRKAELLRDMDVEVLQPSDKATFLGRPMDALVVNASGGSLDSASVLAICRNPRLKIICGSENLAMPNPTDVQVLLSARALLCPTELGGMMGYLTAVEEYLATHQGVPYSVATLFDAARGLEEPIYEASDYCRRKDFKLTLEDALRQIFK